VTRRIATILLSTTLVSLSLLAISVGQVSGAPTTVRYPSVTCPSDAAHTLQTCIDSLATGSTVKLARDVIDESASISASLTLEPAQGFHPTLSLVGIGDGGPSSRVEVTIQNVRISDGILARFT
jgi:hypothetical protein